MYCVRLLVLIIALVGFSSLSAFAANVVESIHDFGANATGTTPQAPPIVGSDGFLYGTTASGGVQGAGTVYRVGADGSDFAVIHHFLFYQLDGATPMASVLEGSDGLLYGTTQRGGLANKGTLFRMKKNGDDYQVLLSFSGTNGSTPESALVESDGVLYGTTSTGGEFEAGTCFKIGRDGSGHTILKNFTNNLVDGYCPQGGVIVATDGFLYGAARLGGASFSGSIYKLAKDGSDFQTLLSFGPSAQGQYPYHRLLEGSDGALYGASWLGAGNDGIVFKLNKDGSNFSVIVNLSAVAPGGRGVTALIERIDGRLYGTTQVGYAGSLFSVNKDGSDYLLVRGFDNYPAGGIVEGTNGKLYGTTQSSFSNFSETIFKIDAAGTGYQILKSFEPNDGRTPSGITLGTDGVLYGTTEVGGIEQAGSVFKLNRDGSGFSNLHSFLRQEGRLPLAGVIEGSDGSLYGMTFYSQAVGALSGTIFSLAKNGTFNRLKTLDAASGSRPWSALIEGLDGNLYGTAQYSGSSGFGTIFRVKKDGSEFTVIHHFNGTLGKTPNTRLAQDSAGVLYGTTQQGGSNDVGVIFKINPNGTDFAVLRNLDATTGCGANDLLVGTDGVLYGTATTGGTSSIGVLFGMKKSGADYQVLVNFDLLVHGGTPRRGLYEDSTGRLVGTVSGNSTGIANGCVYSVDKSGQNFVVEHRFSDDTLAGPTEAPVTDARGHRFGIAFFGGSGNAGAIYRLVRNIAIERSSPQNISAFTDSEVSGIRVRVLDGAGQPVSKVRVRFEISGTPASGAFKNSSAVYPDNGVAYSDADGYVLVPAYIANSVLGTYQLKASLVSAPTVSVNFNITNLLFEFAPVALLENSPAGTLAGTFTQTPGVQYTLVNGTGADDNALFTLNGTALKTAAVFDYEQQSTFKIRVRAVAPDGLASEKTFVVPLLNQNEPPTLVSALTATPNPAFAGQTVWLIAIASDVENQPLIVSFDYGDGTSGMASTHSYATPQQYTVTATFSDGALSVSSSTTVTILAAANPNPNPGSGPGDDPDGDGVPNSIDTDDDGDGMSDAMEILAGSDPLNSGSTPLKNNGAAPAMPSPIELPALQVVLNFSKANSDAMKLQGLIALEGPVENETAVFLVDIGGVMRSFTVRKRGGAKAGNDTFRITVPARSKTVVLGGKFALSLRKGSFAEALADELLTNETVTGRAVTVPVTIVFDGQLYRSSFALKYKAKQGKTGSAKK